MGTVTALAAAGGLVIMADGSAAQRSLPEIRVSVPTRFVFEDLAPPYPEPSQQPIPRLIDPADLGQPLDQIESLVAHSPQPVDPPPQSTLARFVAEHPGGPGVFKPQRAPSLTKSVPAPEVPVTIEKAVVATPTTTPTPAPAAVVEPGPVVEAPVETPAPAPEAPPAPVPTGPVLTPSGRVEPTAEQWASLRYCEATGNYQAVNPSGKYQGAYQFDQSTWESVGGTGDPAAAGPAEQDLRAYILYDIRGASPWPQCGRFLPQG